MTVRTLELFSLRSAVMPSYENNGGYVRYVLYSMRPCQVLVLTVFLSQNPLSLEGIGIEARQAEQKMIYPPLHAHYTVAVWPNKTFLNINVTHLVTIPKTLK